jgi:aspartate/methionine/tyrosine aminotransferase
MGRALAQRAVALVHDPLVTEPSTDGSILDLVHTADVELPAPVRDAAKAALDRGETHYTTRPGIMELRSAIAERIATHGLTMSASDVVVTNGGAEALFIAMKALITSPREVHYAGVAPASVVEMIQFFGATCNEIPGTVEGRFLPSLDEITAARAEILVLQTPSPLTGVSYASDELQAILRYASDSDVTVVLDQSVASRLDTADVEPFSDLSPDMKLITIGSFSVEYGMGGWRIGWFTASKPFIKEMSGFKQTMSICTTAVSQYAALAALETSGGWMADRRSDLMRKRREVSSLLEDAGLSVLAADALPYLLVTTTSIHPDDREARSMLQASAGVDVLAGSDLHASLQGYARINLAAKEPVEGARRIADFVRSMKGSTPQ